MTNSKGGEAGLSPWLNWREPRPLPDGTFETRYHHPLVEVAVLGDEQTRAVSPIELPEEYANYESLRWRPMPWAIEGGGRHKDWPITSPGGVIEGADGYLFLRDNGAFEQIFEAAGLSDDYLERWVALLEARREWCDTRGISYRILIVPEKQSIYPDKLPGFPRPSPLRPVRRILDRVDERLRAIIIYPLEVLEAARSEHETCYRTDVHWTRYGAYLSYRELMATLPDCSPERTIREHDLRQRPIRFLGDLGRHVDAAVETVTWMDPPPVPALKSVIKGTSFSPGQVDVFETETLHLPHAVMFRTSNATHLFPLLMWHFSRLTAVATGRFIHELVESEKPDVVITEMPERYLIGKTIAFSNDPISIPNDFEAQSFLDFTGHGLPLPTDMPQ